MTQTIVQPPAPNPTCDPGTPRHTWLEDVAGLLTGAFLASVGLSLLDAGGVGTGGVAGLALLVARWVPVGFGVLFFLLSMPFVALAISRKGWSFTLRSAAALGAMVVFTKLQPLAIQLEHVDRLYAALVGNLCAGLAILILFRHGASLGGFNVVALIAQERRGWRAGYVQLALDSVVVASFFFVGSLSDVLVTALGAVMLNSILVMNHRPGRYTGAVVRSGPPSA